MAVRVLVLAAAFSLSLLLRLHGVHGLEIEELSPEKDVL